MKKMILLLFFFVFSEKSIPISLLISQKEMINLMTELFLNNFFYPSNGSFCENEDIYKKYNITEKSFLYNYFFYTKKIENHIDILKKVQENIIKRHRAESNRYKRFCRPLPFQSATVPNKLFNHNLLSSI